MLEFFSNLFRTQYVDELEVLKSNHAELQSLQNRIIKLQLDKLKIKLTYNGKIICEIPRHELKDLQILNGNAAKVEKSGNVVGSAFVGFLLSFAVTWFNNSDFYELQDMIRTGVFMIIGAISGLRTETEYIGIQQIIKITWQEYGIERFVMLHLEYKDVKESKKSITEYYQLNEPIQALPALTPETLRLMNELELLNDEGEKLLNKPNSNQQLP